MLTLTENFRALRRSDRLVASLRKKPGVLCLLTSSLTFGAIAVFPLLGILTYHYNMVGNCVFLGLGFLGLVPFLWYGASRLLPRPLVLDRLRNRVYLNGRVLCDLTELHRVEAKRYFFRGRWTTSRMTQLNLIVGSGVRLTVWESVAFSVAEVEAVGRALADFAGVDLVCSSANPQGQTAT